MKTLTKTSPSLFVENQDFKLFEVNNRVTFPKSLSELVRNYNGASVEEIIYNREGLWIINFFLEFKQSQTSISLLTMEINSGTDIAYIPFAIDPGGWHYCFSIKPEDYGSVYVYRWTDYTVEEAFVKIAPSLEYFIDSLHKE